MFLRPPRYFSKRSRSFSRRETSFFVIDMVRPVFLHPLELAHALEARLDGAEVRERAAEPAVDDEVAARARGLLADDLLGLALGADHEDVAAAGDRVDDEVGRRARRGAPSGRGR